VKGGYFSSRLLAVWLTAAGLVFACSFYFMTRDNSASSEPDALGPSTYSRSAIGYAGAYRLLQQQSVPVQQGGGSVEELQASGDVLVIAEPSDEGAIVQQVAGLMKAPVVLMVLPKRKGKADERRSGYLNGDELLEPAQILPILALADAKAAIERPDKVNGWQMQEPFADAPMIRDVQLIHSSRIKPLIAAQEGTLLGEVTEDGRRLVVLADPDLFANHGLARGQNARLMLQIVQNVRAGSPHVIFDEDIHGFTVRPGHTLDLLFRWPLILLTLQVCMAAAFLIWSSAGRFGAPGRLPPPLGSGKASLIASSAKLLANCGQTEFLSERYRETMIRDVSTRLRHGRSATLVEVEAWFARRDIPVPDPSVSRNPLDAAHKMHVWRKKVLNESRQRSKHN
jgi:hypothetical protein